MARTMFRDRVEAGDVLAGRLGHYAGRDDVLVLGLPGAGSRWRHGSPRPWRRRSTCSSCASWAFRVTRSWPWGRSPSGGVQVVNEQVVDRLGPSEAVLRQAAEAEGRELARREQRYREGRVRPTSPDGS